jgi:hypothetical protein
MPLRHVQTAADHCAIWDNVVGIPTLEEGQ